MNSSIKKFTTVFLLAAILVSSLSWGVSAFTNRPEAGAAGQSAELSGDAFRPPTEGWRTVRNGGPDGENLTTGVISIFAQQLVAVNPQGPQTGSDGLTNLLLPPGTDIGSYLDESRPLLETFAPPVDESRIRLTAEPSRDDVLKYLEALINIHNDLSEDPAWKQMLGAPAGASEQTSWIARGGGALQVANDRIYAEAAPAPLLEFHRSLLAMSGALSASVNIAAGDPVSSVLIAEKLKDVLAGRQADLERATVEAEEMLSEILAGLPPEESASVLAKISGVFAIPTAHAQLAVADPITHVGIWQRIGQWILDNWQGIAMGQLKVQLINRLSEEVIQWAQGSGAPGFVQNWLIFEARNASKAARDAIRLQSAALCGNAASEGVYGSVIASVLGGEMEPPEGGYGTTGDPPDCPKRSERGYEGGVGAFRLDNFLDSIIYNPFNDIITIDTAATNIAAAAARAAINEAQAGRGLLNVNKCDNGSDPDGEGDCAEGEPRAVTLASFKQDLTSKAGGAVVDLITGADSKSYDSIADLATSAFGVILSAALGESGLFSAGGGEGGGDDAAPAATLEGRLDQYKRILGAALGNNQRAISAIDSAIDLLRNAIPVVCTNEAIVAQALDLSDGLLEVSDSFRAQTPGIQGLLDTVLRFQAEIAANPDGHGLDLDDLNAEMAFTTVTGVANQSLSDKDDAEEALEQANGLLQSCNSI